MKKRLDQKEITVLECLRQSEVALGSWNLVEKLEQMGLTVSSATIGRVLNSLERVGYVQKEGYSGRIITPQGVQALRDSEVVDNISRYQEALENVITPKTLEDFLQILQARRAIEREIAGLAAVNITQVELRRLEELLAQQHEVYGRGESIAQIDIAFHQTIARASRNVVLDSLYHMLFPYGQQTPAFESMRRTVGRGYKTAHRSIVDALAAHDPALAEKAMVEHIDGLLQDVATYWDILEEQSE